MKASRLRFHFGFALALLSMGCPIPFQVAGGGTETGNGTIVGAVAYPGGMPAIQARITLRPRNYLPLAGDGSGSGGGSGGMNSGPKRETFSDSLGAFSFHGMDTGDYLLEVKDAPGRQAVLLNCLLERKQMRVDLQGELQPTGTIRGSLRNPDGGPARVSIQVYGLERVTATDDSGFFLLDGMPRGEYTLRLVPAVSGAGSMDFPKVQVRTEGREDIGSVELPPRTCEDYACDSNHVRSILDLNGLTGTAVTAVTRTGSGLSRITEVNLSGLGLAVLPPEVGQLGALAHLDLSDNALDSLPKEIGNLRSLHTLLLSRNRLPSLPAEITSLVSLKRLFLKGNALAALPEDMDRLRSLEFLDAQDNRLEGLPAGMSTLDLELELDHNRLCTLTPEMEAWIKSHDANFSPATQTCP